MTSSIITEDNVSANILSFTRQNFLFTRTVCKSWYKNGKGTATHVHRAVDSISTVDEAYECEYPLNLYAPYIDALENKSDISVFEYLVRTYEFVEEGALYAAQHGRPDVLQLFLENEQDLDMKIPVLDKRTLHTAVQHGQLETLVYLMSAGCPVDETRIEWGFGENVVEELKMCSMEMAARDGRLDIMKQLRTNVLPSTPFPHETVEYSIEGGHLDVLKYIKDVCRYDVFGRFLFKALSDGDMYDEVAFLVSNDLVKDTFPAVVCAFEDGETDMVDEIVINTAKSTEAAGLVDQALGSYRNKGICLASYLVCEHNIMPTPDAYNCLLRTRLEDGSLVILFSWLYDDLGIRVNPEGLTNLANHSAAVQQWFHDRCRSCRINFKDGNNGVKRKRSV